MRTEEEILQKVKDLEEEGRDWMGTTRSDLLDFLSFEKAKPFLIEGVTVEQWADVCKTPADETVKAVMLDYLDFAFEKAHNQRGLSAGRSMDHYYAWIWLLDEEDRFGDVREYDSYGIPHLQEIEAYLKGGN